MTEEKQQTLSTLGTEDRTFEPPEALAADANVTAAAATGTEIGYEEYAPPADPQVYGDIVQEQILPELFTERPQLADQHDTTVAPAHRGHRLGLVLKGEMVRWLRDVEPQVEEISTWNAESNAHMIAVNEQLGYEVLGRALSFQTGLTP